MKKIQETHTLALQKLIFGAHLNAANCLFGGHLLSWIDEASAMYAMDIMQTRRILTKKISEVIFINPALLGDMIQFWCKVSKEGNSSLTMELSVITKNVDTRQQREICSCEIVYVAVDELGKPYPWKHLKE
ncbi:MAG: acyl-CoA thioesterase [Candidatus Cloacimonadota bacterium]|nr:MAG: acyl-CoA thioesterase [Candidatus Cloacimonadota bacterium]